MNPLNLIQELETSFINESDAIKSFIQQAFVALQTMDEERIKGIVNACNGKNNTFIKRFIHLRRSFFAMRELAELRNPEIFIEKFDAKQKEFDKKEEIKEEVKKVVVPKKKKLEVITNVSQNKKFVSKKNPGINLPE